MRLTPASTQKAGQLPEKNGDFFAIADAFT